MRAGAKHASAAHIGSTVILGAGAYLYNTTTGLITGYPAIYGTGGPSTPVNFGTVAGG
jgi:hypothetical protein